MMECIAEIKLRDVFKKYVNKSFVFIKPGGNWGDLLIYCGAEFLADSLGLKYRSGDSETFNFDSIRPDEIVYLHGGGGFNPWCSGRAGEVLKRAILSKSSVVIQGPASYDNDKNYVLDFFGELSNVLTDGKEVFVFAREYYSLDLLKKILPDPIRLCFDQDTALHLTRQELLKKAPGIKPKYDLLALREDDESPVNIGKYGAGGVLLDPARYAQSFEQWVKIHAAAKTIVTNRTHTSVAGAILGVPTTLLAGSYHKNRSIWEAFLKDRHVIWAEYQSLDSSIDLSLYERVVPRAIKNSWKVRRLANWFKGVPS